MRHEEQLVVSRSLLLCSAYVDNFMVLSVEQCQCRLREVLVKKESHDANVS